MLISMEVARQMGSCLIPHQKQLHLWQAEKTSSYTGPNLEYSHASKGLSSH